MRRQRRSVSRQRQSKRLGQAVHRIRREHARTRPAGRAGVLLDRRHILVADAVVGCDHHRVDQVERHLLAPQDDLARLHRPARDEDGGNVQPHRRHQHARRDLVAVGDADHRIGAMGIDHVFDGVGDQLARGQRIQHPVMAHRDPVIDRDGVELLGHAARRLDLARDQLAQVLQMHMARHELRERIGDGDDRLAEIAVLHAGGAPQPAGAGHVAAMGRGAGTIGGHVSSSGQASLGNGIPSRPRQTPTVRNRPAARE